MTDTAEPELTLRQREVLVLVGESLSIPEIAEQMGLHPSTVKQHIALLRRHYGVQHKRQLVPIGRRIQP